MMMVETRLWLAVGALLVAGPAIAGPLTAGIAAAVAYQYDGSGHLDGPYLSFGSTPDLFQASAYVSPTARAAVTSDTRTLWTSRLAIDAAAGGSDSTRVLGFGIGVFGANQRVEGAGGTAHISYTFNLDGSFFPGDQSRFARDPFPQEMRFILAAYSGQLLGTRTVHDGSMTDFRIVTNVGEQSLLAPDESPLHVDLPDDEKLAEDRVCLGVTYDDDSPCIALSGLLDRTLSIGFDIPVGEDFWVAAGLRGITDGQLDALHTARLISIALTPGFDLISDDGGALRRRPDGTYGLVPEPATWALMLAGFGAVGFAVRRRRTQARATGISARQTRSWPPDSIGLLAE